MATIDNDLAPIHLDVETVLEKVIEQFPGTEVLWDDLHNQLKIDYAIRIQASALSNRPYSPRMQRRIMDDIVNKMNGKAILIRLKCGNIVGLALDRNLNFYSKSEFNQESKKRGSSSESVGRKWHKNVASGYPLVA